MPAESGRRPHVVVVGSINMDLVVRVARLPRPGETLSGHDLPVILDPAPAPSRPLPPVLWNFVQMLTPNQTEAEALTGMPVTNLAEAERAARALCDQGARYVVLKLGESGALAYGRRNGRV